MVQLAIDQMSCEMKAKGAVDVFKWWLFMATDIIGELSFGESFRILEKGEVKSGSVQEKALCQLTLFV